MTNFQPGQIVKQNYGAIAHYAIVVAENRTIGWVNTSTLEVKLIENQGWEVVKIRGEVFDFDTIKRNIRSFKDALETSEVRQYHPTEFNCEHWATLMVTGRAYSTQSGTVKFATPTIIGGAMIGVGASAGTVVSIVSTIGVAASTGTAISSLSGAAATNAALAWLGGGTLAAGGGGVAAGAAIVSAVSTGGAVIAIAGVGIISKQVWENLSPDQRQAIIKTIDHATPDQIKVAYGVTVDTATEMFDIASGWLGERTSKISQSVEAATPKHIKIAGEKVIEMSHNTAEFVAENAKTVAEQATQQMNNASNAVGSWFRGWTSGKKEV